MPKSIFISHSVANKEIADALVDLFETGVGISDSDVFCSSLEGLGIPSGVNFVEFIRTQIESPRVVVLLLTKEYYESKFCLAELGASWVLCHRIIPLLVPPLAFKDVEAVLTGTQLLKIDSKSDLNQMYSDLLDACNIGGKSFSRWEAKRDSFLKRILSSDCNKSPTPAAQGGVVPTFITSHHIISHKNTRLTCCSFKDSDRYIVVGGFSGLVSVIEVKTGITTDINCGKSSIRCIIPRSSGSDIIVGDDLGRILLVDIAHRDFKELTRCDSSVYSMTLSSNGENLYTAERNGSVTEWEFNTKDQALIRLRVIHTHSATCFCVGISSTAQTCFSVGADGNLLTSEINGEISQRTSVSNKSLFTIAWRNGDIAIGDSAGTLKVGKVGNDTFRSYQGHSDAIRALDISRTGKWCCTASKDKTLRVWELKTRRAWIIAHSDDYFYDVQFSCTNSKLIACDGGGKIHFFDLIQPIDSFNNADMNELIKTWE